MSNVKLTNKQKIVVQSIEEMLKNRQELAALASNLLMNFEHQVGRLNSPNLEEAVKEWRARYNALTGGCCYCDGVGCSGCVA